MYAAARLYKYGLQKARNEIASLTSFDDEVEFIDYDSLSKDEKDKMAEELDTFLRPKSNRLPTGERY